MIKFRKGNLITQAMPALPEIVLAPVVATPMAPAASSKKWQSDQINLEWWQTPLKYKRRDLDEAAMKVLSRKAILFAFSRLLEFETNAIARSRHSCHCPFNVRRVRCVF